MSQQWHEEGAQHKRARKHQTNQQYDPLHDQHDIWQSHSHQQQQQQQQQQQYDYHDDNALHQRSQHTNLNYDHSNNHMNNQSLNQHMHNSFNQPMNQSMNSSMNSSLNQSTNSSMNHSMNHSMNPAMNQSMMNRLMNQTMSSAALNPSLNHSLSQSNLQQLNQSMNQSMNPSGNPAFNQSIAQTLSQFNQTLLGQTLNQYPNTFADALSMPNMSNLLDERLLAPFLNQSLNQSLNATLGLSSASPAMNMQQAAEAFFARSSALGLMPQPAATLAQAIAATTPPQQHHQLSPTHSANATAVSETITLSTLTCLIEKQYTIRKTESDRMTETERKQLVQVNVRILKEKTSPATPPQRVTGVKRERDADRGQPNVQCPPLYIPATDIGPLLNIRKNNIPGYISKYDTTLRQQMMVDCPRAAGGVARVQLNVLTLAGAEKFIVTSRSKQAEKVWSWIEQHVNKVKEREVQQLMEHGTPETTERHVQVSTHSQDGLDDSFSDSLLDLKDADKSTDPHIGM